MSRTADAILHRCWVVDDEQHRRDDDVDAWEALAMAASELSNGGAMLR